MKIKKNEIVTICFIKVKNHANLSATFMDLHTKNLY